MLAVQLFCGGRVCVCLCMHVRRCTRCLRLLVYCVSCKSHDRSHACPSPVGWVWTNGVGRDNKKAGVLKPAMSKIKSLNFATEAAITILHIDDMAKLAPEKSEEGSNGDAVARGKL